MALRNPHALLGTFVRAGVLCLAPAQRTCIDHGLPETPDSFSFSPIRTGAATCSVGWFLESWDSTSVVFVSSHDAVITYLRAAVEHSYVA